MKGWPRRKRKQAPGKLIRSIGVEDSQERERTMWYEVSWAVWRQDVADSRVKMGTQSKG